LEALEEDCADLLLHVGLGLSEEAQHDNAEEERVAVRVAQLVEYAVQEAEASLIIQRDRDLFE